MNVVTAPVAVALVAIVAALGAMAVSWALMLRLREAPRDRRA